MKKKTIYTLLSFLGIASSCWTKVVDPQHTEPVVYETVLPDLAMPSVPPDLDIYRADLNDGILRVLSVSPTSDYQKGGGTVKIFGSNIQDGAIVLFGKNQATVLDRDPNGTWIQVLVPPHKTGTNFDNPSKEAISITNPSSPPVALADAFRYIIEKPEFITNQLQVIRLQWEAVLPVDATNDGYPDLIIPDPRGLAIRINNRDRTFGVSQPAITNTSPYPLSSIMAAGDLNQDLISDLVIACNDSTDRYFCFLRGNGNGTFSGAGVVKLNPFYRPIIWLGVVDMNLDGKQDIVGITEDGYIPVYQGDGNFGAAFRAHCLFSPSMVCDGPATFSSKSYMINSATKPSSPPDIAIGCDAYSSPSMYRSRNVGAIISGDTVQGCRGSSVLTADDGILGISLSDLNGDDKLETIIANARNKLVIDTKPVLSPVFPDPPGPMAAADINYDGKTDLIMSTNYDFNYTRNRLFYTLGNGDKTLRSPFLISDLTLFADGIVAVDFDKDNRMDFMGYVRRRAGSTTGGRTVPSVAESTTIYFGIGN